MGTARAVVVTAPGDRSVLHVHEIAVDPPGEGQVQIEVSAAGVNFIDVYQRQGVYPLSTPFVLGNEGAGTVTAVGDGVTGISEGDLVAWAQVPGSQATSITTEADRVVRVPDGVDARTAAAVMLQGLTAHYLVTSSHPVVEGDVALVHAAAGGVGQLLVQLITARGGTVVATAGSRGKLDIARRLGAEHTIDYTGTRDLAASVREAVGRGVDVVYDGVGRDTFDASLESLRPRGILVLFGGSSGQVAPFDLQRLNAGGSLFITRPSLGHHVADRAEFERRARELFSWIANGTLEVAIGGTYAFDEVAQAYEDLEERRSVGKLLLVP